MVPFSTIPKALDDRNTILALANHTHPIENIIGLPEALAAKIDYSLRGRRNGVASLDALGHIPASQMPYEVGSDFNGDFNGDFGGNTSAGVVAGGATFPFPKDGTISQSDIGKFVMNVRGLAKLTQKEMGRIGTLGAWRLYINANIVPHDQAIWEIHLNELPADGAQVHFLFPSAAIDLTYVFLETLTGSPPDGQVEVQLGTDVPSSRDNLQVAIAATITTPVLVTESEGDDKVIVTVGDDFIGDAGNDLLIATGGGMSGVHFNGADNLYQYLSGTLLTYEAPDREQRNLFWWNVLSPLAPNGTLLNGIKYPDTLDDLRANVFWALQYNSNFSDYFDMQLTGFNIDFGQKQVQYHPDYQFFVVQQPFMDTDVDGDFQLAVTTPPVHQIDAFIKHPVLGVVVGVDEDLQNAVIMGADFVKLKLTDQTAITFDANLPLTITPRLVIPTDNGEAELLATFIDRFDDHDKQVVVSGLPIYEVMEEAPFGAEVLARRYSSIFGLGAYQASQPYYYQPL